MRVKSFLVSFLFVCFVAQLPAETVTLKNYPATQTDSEGRTENQKFSILYDTDENELSFWFVEDFGAWSTRYWFDVGRYGRKKIGKILAKAEEWATAAKTENLTIEKEFPFNEFTGDISRNELKVTDYGRTDICFYFVAKAGRLPGYVGISERSELQRHFKGAKSRGEKEKRLIKIEINIPVGNL